MIAYPIGRYLTIAHAHTHIAHVSNIASTIDNWTEFVLLITPASAAVLQEAVLMDLGGTRLVVRGRLAIMVQFLLRHAG